MKLVDTHVPSATDNPLDPRQLPLCREPLELIMPVRTRAKDDDQIHARKILIGILVSTAVAVVELSVVLIWEAFTLVHAVVFWVVSSALLQNAITQRTAPFRPAVNFTRFTLLVSLANVALVTSIHLMDGYRYLLPVSLIGLVHQMISFRRHTIAEAVAGMHDRETVRRFRWWKQIPATLHPCSRWQGFVAAVQSYLSYGRDQIKSPASLRSPAGAYVWRLASSIFSVTLITMSIYIGFSSRVIAWINDLLEPLLFEPGKIAAISWVLICPIAGMLGWLVALALSIWRFSGRALALKEAQISTPKWRPMLDRLEGSANEIERESLWLGWVSYDYSPILWPISKLFQHSWICGSTGSGKTSWLLAVILDQLIYRKPDVQVIVIDLKSHTYEMLSAMQRAAADQSVKCGRSIPVKYFTLREGDATYLLDVFSQGWWKQLATPQRTGVILSALSLQYSAAYGESYYRDSAYKFLSHVLDRHPMVGSWAELVQRLRDAQRGAKPHELSERVKQDGEHVLLIIERLASLAALNCDAAMDQQIRDEAIDFLAGHCYFALNALENGLIAGEVGRLVTGAILGAARAMPNRETILVIDEWQEMVSRDLERLLSQARSLGVGVVLSNQYTAQLITKDMDMRSTIEANTNLQAWMKVTDDIGREQLRRLGGQEIIPLFGYQIRQGQTASISVTETVQDRIPGTLASRVSSDPMQLFMRLTENAGYAQFHDLIFAARSMFHQDKTDYEDAQAMPWPAGASGTLINRHRIPKQRRTTSRSVTIGP
ncbi:helicase HerA domain-containing protein [Rhodopirellula sp. JC639]|uniref:helicase HerA domain-containing protein n=1 Tax=Stieleria mannarensis TaxID=2755585 RepID=UPI0016024BCC|nr:DUF87 domain-containing protein [Rhodopirellula sp. JC639]